MTEGRDLGTGGRDLGTGDVTWGTGDVTRGLRGRDKGTDKGGIGRRTVPHGPRGMAVLLCVLVA